MREIKFRAWDKKDKEMFYQTGINKNWEDILDFLNELWEFVNKCEDTEKFELMQFVGLKDKNGKEIYEGDVVKNFSFVSNSTWTLTINDIVYDNHKIARDEKDREVIGNKFEHPELLK